MKKQYIIQQRNINGNWFDLVPRHDSIDEANRYMQSLDAAILKSSQFRVVERKIFEKIISC